MKILFTILSVILHLGASAQGRGTDFYHVNIPTYYTDVDTISESNKDTIYTTADKFEENGTYHTIGFQISIWKLASHPHRYIAFDIYGSKEPTDTGGYSLVEILLANTDNGSIGFPSWVVGCDIPSNNNGTGFYNCPYKYFRIVITSSGAGDRYAWQAFMLIH